MLIKRFARHARIEGASADFFINYIKYYISELVSAFHSYYAPSAQNDHTTYREIKRGFRVVTSFSNSSVQAGGDLR